MKIFTTVIIDDSLVVENKQLAEKTFILTIKAKKIVEKVKPGQFIKIRANSSFPLLDRPLSVSNVVDKDKIALIYRVVGKATLSLSKLKSGDTVKISGPFGSSIVEHLNEANNKLYLVGGGIGLAPMPFIYNYYKNFDIKVFYGERFASLLMEQSWLKSWAKDYISTVETGNAYVLKGLITKPLREALEKEKRPIFACGPKAMLKAVVSLAEEYKVAVWVSVEERMACAYGICLSCSLPLKTGKRFRVCKEGPVCDGTLVDWK